MKRPLSKPQIILFVALWVALSYMVLTLTDKIDGPTIVMLLVASALVWIPIYKSLKKKK